MLNIRAVSGTDLGLKTGCSDRFFFVGGGGVHSVPGKSRDSVSSYTTTTAFRLHFSLIVVQSCIV